MKNTIYRKFMELARKHGTSKVSLSLLASELGMSKANLYTYFRDKEEIIFGTIIYFGTDMIEKMKRLIHSTDMTSLEKLDRYLSGHIEFSLDERSFFDIFHDIMLNHMVKDKKKLEQIFKLRKRVIDEFSVLVDELKEDGYITEDIPSKRVSLYIDGLLFIFVKDFDSFEKEQKSLYVKEIKNIILKGFGDSL